MCTISLARGADIIDCCIMFSVLTRLQVDTREPDVMRLAPAPLYNSFVDVHRFVTSLGEALRHVLEHFESEQQLIYAVDYISTVKALIWQYYSPFTRSLIFLFMHIYVCNGPKYIRKWWTFKSLKVAMDVIFYFQSLVDEVSWIVIIIASSYLCLVERFFLQKRLVLRVLYLFYKEQDSQIRSTDLRSTRQVFL